MKILLISPFCLDSQYPIYLPSENLGLAYIASYLRKKGLIVDIFDANMYEYTAKDIVKKIDLNEYGLIGIALSSHLLLNEVLAIAKEVKKIHNLCHITTGGHFATFQAEKILESCVDIDSVVMRDGEETTYELVKCLSGCRSFDQTLGLCFKNEDGLVKTNPPRVLAPDLNLLPWPARDTLNYLKELNHTWPTQIASSRGCYGNCAYCDTPNFYGKIWRARSAEDVVDEIEFLNKEYEAEVFRFSDDEFIGPNPKGPIRAENIAREIIRRKFKVKLMIDARAQAVNKDLFLLLKEAGVIDCLIGIESGVDRILKLYNKGMTTKDNVRAIKLLKELGISLNLAFIMIDPRMSFEELIQNYRFLQENDIVGSYSLKTWLWPLHGTPLVRHLKSQGLVINESLEKVTCKFVDQKVEKFFQIIKACKEICFPLEREIFLCIKNNLLLEVDLTDALNKKEQLWINIFEDALKYSDWNDFESLKKEIRVLVDMIQVKHKK